MGFNSLMPNIDITLPGPNRTISGAITLPAPSKGEMTIEISLLEGEEDVIYNKSIAIPKNTTMHSYQTEFLTEDETKNYNLKYTIYTTSNYQYYTGLDMYLSENGFTPNFDECAAFPIGAQSESFTVDIDISDLLVTGYIKGKFVLPDEYVIPPDKYFACPITATNGEHIEESRLYIPEGENKTSYIIPIPDIYNKGEWTVYYVAGQLVEEPTQPVVPVSQGGTNTGGGSINPSRLHLPANILSGYKIYVTENGLSINAADAKKFVLANGGVDGVNITALGSDFPAPRTVGGFFTTEVKIPEGGISVSVTLQNISTGEELTQDFIFTGGAVKYKFETTDGEYILKYNIDGEIYYYKKNCILTDDIGSATIISTVNTSAQYQKDVYYKNIYPQSYYAKFLSVIRIYAPIATGQNIRLLIYDTDGSLLEETYNYNRIAVSKWPIVIGYEAGGNKGYFTQVNGIFISGITTDFSEAARIYLSPKNHNTAECYLDISSVGFADGVGTTAKIESSYFNYDQIDEETLLINNLNISVSNREAVENDNIFVVCYDEPGRMKFLKKLSFEFWDNQIDLGWLINKTDTIKIIGIKNNNITPIFEPLSFFGKSGKAEELKSLRAEELKS